MSTIQYSRAITIHDFEGTELGNGNTIADKKRAKTFLTNVKNALDGLKKLTTGRTLLDEIDDTGKTVDIICAGPGKDGCAMTKPNGNFASQYAAQIVSFRPTVLNLEQGTKDRSSNKGIAGRTVDMPSRGEEYHLKKVAELRGFEETDENMAPEFANIMKRARAKYPTPFKTLSQLTGVERIKLLNMAVGKERIDDDTYFKICVYMYDFLTPGEGCNTVVRLVFDVGLAGTDGKRNYKKSADAVEPRIMAGHELIHAWRMMTGRRLVRSGWEEEAMTVGLGFAAGWRITENRLRLEAGQPRRPNYSGLTQVSSNWAAGWKGSANQ